MASKVGNNDMNKKTTLAGLQAQIASLPTYAKDAKMTMHIDQAQELVNTIKSLEPPFNEPEWCARTQAIIDERKKQLQEGANASTTRSR